MHLIDNYTRDKSWLDFSTIALFWRCPRAYYWRTVKEVTVASGKASLINGKAYHEAKATYLKARMEGKSHVESAYLGVQSLKPIMAEITEDDPKRNLSVATETMLNYFEQWKNEPYKTIAVEVPFAIDFSHFLYVGKIDAIKEGPFGVVVEETKTTSIVGDRWQSRGKPNAQLDGYIAGVVVNSDIRVYGGMLDIIPIHESSAKRKKPFRIITSRANSDIESWMRNIQEWWHTIQIYKEGNFYPQNTESCVPLLGYTCDYTTLCSLYPNPHNQSELQIPEQYVVEPWAPYDLLNKLEEEKTNGT